LASDVRLVVTVTEQPTMLKLWDNLTNKDKAVLCRIINNESNRHKGRMHVGLLPFITIEHVLECLKVDYRQTPDPQNNRKRRNARLQAMLRYYVPSQENVFFAYLSVTKVIKHFGAHGERGKVMNFLPVQKVTAGTRWNLPSRSYIPDDDVHVHPTVSVSIYRWEGSGRAYWRICCDKRYWLAVHTWLRDNCT